jgi:hypothetical protein
VIRALCRRLRIAVLRARVAQLQCAASHMRCTTPQDAVHQSHLLALASLARCEIAALEMQR